MEPVKEAVVEGAKSAVRDFFHDMVDSIKSFLPGCCPDPDNKRIKRAFEYTQTKIKVCLGEREGFL